MIDTMGEIADDMIEGRSCSQCGQYFSEDGEELYEHGYPVLCADCYEEDGDMSSLQKARVPTL